jgi:hypothetical protein
VGVQKPRWLPDLGVAERRAVLERFFGPVSRPVYEELLDPGFHMSEQLRGEVSHSRTYGKDDWIELMCNSVAPAIPDFNWSAATDGKADAGEPQAKNTQVLGGRCVAQDVEADACVATALEWLMHARADMPMLKANRCHPSFQQTGGPW